MWVGEVLAISLGALFFAKLARDQNRRRAARGVVYPRRDSAACVRGSLVPFLPSPYCTKYGAVRPSEDSPIPIRRFEAPAFLYHRKKKKRGGK